MNRSLAFAIAAVCLAAERLAAQAADMPRANPLPYYKRRKRRSAGPGSTSASTAVTAGAVRAGAIRRSAPIPERFNTPGALLGGQLGYNWQTGRVVLGIETDADWTNIKGSAAAPAASVLADGGGMCQTKQDWFGTTRGRIGYAFGRFLPYVTGGAAYGDIKALQSNGTATQTKFGWTAGGGVEYSLNRNWSAKVEYLHLDLGTAGTLQRGAGCSVAVGSRQRRSGAGRHQLSLVSRVSSCAVPVRRPPPARPRAIRA